MQQVLTAVHGLPYHASGSNIRTRTATLRNIAVSARTGSVAGPQPFLRVRRIEHRG